MKQGRTDRDWAVVATLMFGAGALIAWALLSKHPPQPRPPAEIDWPAWVQAVGSIVAIFVAVLVPWRQRNQQLSDASTRDKKADAREQSLITSMHIALYQPMENFRGSCDAVLTFLTLPLVDREQIPEDVFDRNPEFDQFRGSLHLMGSTGRDINILIAQQDHLRTMLRGLRSQPDPLDRAFIDKARKSLEKGRDGAARIRTTLAEVGNG